MVNIFITTTCEVTDFNPNAFDNFERVKKWAVNDRIKKHGVVDSPDRADIVLFVGDRRFYHSGIYISDIFKQHQHKSLVIDFTDRTIPRIPGLYATIPTYLQQYPIYEYLFYDHGGFDRHRADALFANYKYLFSFMGSVKTHPSLRGRMTRLSHPRAYLHDTVVYPNVDVYNDVMINSKFILCPRGVAPSTIRVFEAMKAVRVPVIVSDEWRENQIDGDWKEFSVRVPEKDVESIPQILEELEFKALEMGQKAFIAWEKNFSPPNCFHWLAETCARIQSLRGDYKNISSRNIYLETLKSEHLIPFWKEFVKGRLGSI